MESKGGGDIADDLIALSAVWAAACRIRIFDQQYLADP